MSQLQILGFAGSLRKGSYNMAALRAATELTPPDVTLSIFDISSIPFYNGDVEALGGPESVDEFKRQIGAADALLIVTPEYNFSIPGVLKNALDWASRRPNPLNGKPVALMGAGGSLGSARAQLHLRQVCVYTNMHPLNKPEVLIKMAQEKFDAEGNLTDEGTRKEIRDLLIALAAWTRRLKQ